MIKILKTRDVKTPNRGTKLSTGIDFYVPNDFERVFLFNKDSVLIHLGIKIILPQGCDMLFINKSGVASSKGLVVGACLIDNDYRGEVMLNLYNIGKKMVTINKGDKIIQGVIQKVNYFEIEEINEIEFDDKTERGDKGFGSTNL